MAEIITGDNTKSIKSVGELALRISKFDSYRLFTLYENVRERKVMDVSGNHKYYLVFKSPNREIRIPEYEPNGFFEVDKVNGCILFKITKKNADDILSMRTSGERIFHIIRVFEERDDFGRVLNVTDEIEVYNGRWGDDNDFNVFTTENKVDLLTKALATQIDKNTNLFKDYSDLQDKYNDEVNKSSELEKELESLRAERDSLQTTLDEYIGNTHEGTLLSTDTKYIAFENAMENVNVSFTEEQYSNALKELMTKNEVNLSNVDIDDPRLDLSVKVYDNIKGLKINIYKNNVSVGSAVYNQEFHKNIDAFDEDEFKFECVGMTSQNPKTLYLEYTPIDNRFDNVINISNPFEIIDTNEIGVITGKINYKNIVDVVGNIGTLKCYIK